MIAARLLAVAGGGSVTLPAPTTLTPNGARVTLFTRANTYAQGLVYTGGVLYLFTTESPSTEHAAGSGGYLRTSSTLDGAGFASARTALFTGTAGRHGNIEGAGITTSGRIIVALDDQSDSDAFDVIGKVIYSDSPYSSWSSPYTVPNSFSGDCVTGPPMQLPSGDVLLPIYGEQTGVVSGNTFARLVRSTDDGATFGSETLIAQSASRTYQEPRLYWDGTAVRALMRSDTNVHTWLASGGTDGSVFGAASDVLVMSGPPDAIVIAPETLFLIGRNDNSTFLPRTAVSTDGAATWTTPAELDTGETRELDGTAWAYLGGGEYLSVYALANSGSSSTLYLRRWTAT